MKFFLLIFFCFFTTISYAEKYYCVDKFSFGLSNDRQKTDFSLERYLVDIDWKTKTILSDELYFTPYSVNWCHADYIIDNTYYMICSNNIGVTFAINRNTMEFIVAGVFLIEDKSYDQALYFTNGFCEKF